MYQIPLGALAGRGAEERRLRASVTTPYDDRKMNLDALPYTVLLILAEFSAGSLAAVLLVDRRRMVAAGYVKLSATAVLVGAALTLLAAVNVSAADMGGYRLEEGLFRPMRGIFAGFLALTLPYLWFTLSGWRRPALVAGWLATALGLAGLIVLAVQVSPPTWGVAGVLLSVLAAAAALGLVSQATILGHWYLVTPKLPVRPLRELTVLLLAVLLLQIVLLAVNAAVPARETPESTAFLTGSLASNPAFWLRVGVGAVFPVALVYLAWRSTGERSMMSATGLLYIAVGVIFVGEVLARGLLFVTAAPV